MQNLVTIWQNLGLKRQIIVVGATLAMFMAILALARSAAAPQMALLYSGLDRAAAGDVIAALEQTGVPYVITGDAISVDSTMRDSLRMTLAAEGLPANSGTGYELLDGLSGFGTTSQMFDAAYWRAKEGELARTILSNPAIRSARVHIAQGANQPFTPDGTPSASVTVTSSGGMTPDQAKAIRHLVAAAVLNLRPEDVEVVDSLRGLMPNTEAEMTSGPAASSRAEEIKRNVERLLSARVGPGKAVVEVMVELVTERETVTEQRIDPQERVAISTETTENSGTAQGANGGAVTVASNLPEGAGGADGGTKSETAETRERVNYEVSQSQREVVRLPGDVRKLSVAVIIDGLDVLAADGTLTKQPRTPDEIAALQELVASAVGLDPARGDVLTLKALDFLPTPIEGTLLEAGLLAGVGPIDVMQLIQLAVLTLVALVLGLFVLRPILLSRRQLPGAQGALAGPAGTLALPPMRDANGTPVLNGVIEDDETSALAAARAKADTPQDPMERLRRLIEERQSESVEILRGWMEQNEEPV